MGEQLAVIRGEKKAGAVVLIVGNDVFEIINNRLGSLLGDEAADRVASPEFSQELREGATSLCIEVPDLTTLLIFVYVGLPMLTIQFLYLGCQWVVEKKDVTVFEVERRE